MKKTLVNYLFLFLALVGFGFLTSCSEDEATPGPSIRLVSPPAPEQAAGDTVEFSVNVEAADKINEITILQKIGTTSTTAAGFPKNKGFVSATTDLFIFKYLVPSTTEPVTLTFRVTDKNAVEKSEEFTIKVTASPTSGGDIVSYDVVLLGSDENKSDPSFYSSSTNERFTVTNAAANSAKIDFGYATGSAGGNEHFIGAPDDESIKATFTSVANWTKKNQTTFKATTLTTAQFDAITKDGLIAINDPGATFTQGTTSRVKATDTQVGKVVAFRTAAGKLGLFKVKRREGTSAAGTEVIELSVKVQD